MRWLWLATTSRQPSSVPPPWPCSGSTPAPSLPPLLGQGLVPYPGPQGQGPGRGPAERGGGQKEPGLRKPSPADRGEIGFSRSCGPAKSTSYRPGLHLLNIHHR